MACVVGSGEEKYTFFEDMSEVARCFSLFFRRSRVQKHGGGLPKTFGKLVLCSGQFTQKNFS